MHKPAILRVVGDDLDKPEERLINEASLRIEFAPSDALFDLLTEQNFTRRGRYTWSLPLADNARNLARFLRVYGNTFQPYTLISSMEDERGRLNTPRVGVITGYHGGNYARQEGWREGTALRRALNAVPRLRFPDFQALPPEIEQDRQYYHQVRNRGYEYRRLTQTERDTAMQRIERDYATFGGVAVEVKNDQFWVRLFPTEEFVAAFKTVITFGKARNVRGTSGKPLAPRDVLRVRADLNHLWGDQVVLGDEQVGALLERTRNVVSVGYAPNQPATVTLYRGENVPAAGRSPLRKFETKNEYTVSLEKVLDTQRRSRGVEFLVHPGLRDIVGMTEAGSYEGEPRLKDYQKIAVGLHLSTKIGYLNSCSPGMGKTVMQLTAMRERAKTRPYYRGIVICEANVRPQWLEEAKRWFPEAEVIMIRTQGDTDLLADTLAAEKPVVVIASYAHTLLAYAEQEQRDAEAARLNAMQSYRVRMAALAQAAIPPMTVGNLLLDSRWDDICADEAVIIRNGSSKQAQIMWTLRKNAEIATALTATPINKSPDDMGRLLSWVRNDRHMFSGKPLSEQYDTTTEKGAKAMFKVFGPLVFRRDTSEIAGSLPTARQNVHLLEPSAAEKALATAAEQELKRCYLELVTALDEVEAAGAADPEELRKAKENLRAANGAWLGGTQLARMATSDPTALLKSESVGAALLAGQGLIDAALRTEPTKRAKFITESQERVAKGEQVIAFTEFASVAETLVQALQDNGINARAYTGRNGSTRDQARKDFQDGKLDVLVCTQAAERGLTLHRASVIYHYDLPWTLEKVIQRTGRMIRIGSEHKNVDVVFMVMQGTVEQRMANHLVQLGMSAALVLDHARGVDVRKTETATAMSGLMSAVTKTSDNKNLRDFGKMLLGV